MARIFDDITNNNPTNVYAGLPVQETKSLNETASEQYKSGRMAKDALDVMANNLEVEDRNYGIKRRVIDNVRDKLKDLTSRGDYQNAQYLIQGITKDLTTDNELQGAIKSNKIRKQTVADLQERLAGYKEETDDKGNTKKITVPSISKESYDYAMNKIRLENTQPIKFNPGTGKIDNMFNAPNIVDDQSQNIAKETMDTIKDWKESASPLSINGDTFITKNIGGVEKVFKNGTEVTYNEVANALKQQISNQDKYKEYLDQKNEIEKYNMLVNPNTGEKRDFNRQDLGYLSDDELKAIATGHKEEDIKKLEGSKNLADKAAADSIRKQQASIDLTNPQNLEAIHDKFNRENTLNRLVYPAAEKASFKKLDYKLYNDDAALEDLKYKHALGLKKYENDLKTQGLPPISNIGTTQKYTGTQYQETQKTLDTYKQDVAQKQSAFNAVQDRDKNDPLYQTRQKDLLDAESTLNVAKTHQEQMYQNISEETKSKLVDQVFGMFNQQEGQMSNWDNRISVKGIKELTQIAAANKDYGLVGKLNTAMSYLASNKEVPSEFAKQLSNTLVQPKYLPTLNDIDEERYSRNTGLGAMYTQGKGESGFPQRGSEVGNLLGGVYGTVVQAPALAIENRISNIMQKEYETNNNMVSNNDIISIPDQGKDNSSAAQSYHALARSSFANATDWTDASGISFDKLLAQPYYTKNFKGDLVETIPDINKSQISPAPGSNDGMTRVSITLKDKDGNDLITKGKGGEERTSMILKSGDPQASQLIYSAAAEYAKKNNDLESYYKLKGDENFGKYFAPIALGQNSDPITIFYPDGKYTKIKMVGDGKDISKVEYADGKNNGTSLFGGKEFRSKDELMQAFEKAYEKDQEQSK